MVEIVEITALGSEVLDIDLFVKLALKILEVVLYVFGLMSNRQIESRVGCPELKSIYPVTHSRLFVSLLIYRENEVVESCRFEY